MPRIRKILIWENPTPVGHGRRWDAEVVYADESHERISGISARQALALVKEAMG